MSRQRKKGTVGENQVRDYMRFVWSDVERTGSDHSSPWGSADFRNTREWSVETKKHKDWKAAIRVGWPQAERNAAFTGHWPMLIVQRHRMPVGRSLVIANLEDMRHALRSHEDYS